MAYGAGPFSGTHVGAQIGGGSAFFAGGPNAASSEMSQTIDLTGAQPEIDAGNLPVTLGADLEGSRPGRQRDRSR